MFVNEVNDVKVYNLSAGKSVPDWLTDRKKRSKLLKKADSRRSIELIQDFDMPIACTSLRMSPDQQYILATGTYKPRVKCYEVQNLSLKFERCFDSEVTTFEPLSDDYSKLIFLQCDRYVEIHAGHGRHYRLRIPKFGLDISYHKPSCDMFIVGTGKDIYRLNLERGQFMQPYESAASCLNACEINPEHQLLLVGAKEGTVEAWDPRTQHRCATLDVALSLPGVKSFPEISTLKFKNAMTLGVGTASGHVLLYDIRKRAPLLTKNHLNNAPIKRLAFNASMNAVYSLDEAMLKLWEEQSGKQIAYIEATTAFNDFCTIPQSGMFFLAQEDIKMLSYYIPAMGPAPSWCAYLDTITRDIETEVVEDVYDDYKFVTAVELQELGLDNLIGTSMARASMHGYFISAQLYNKAKAVAAPFDYAHYRKDKVRKQIESERQTLLPINKHVPKVNAELAADPELADPRFKALFENVDFQINKEAVEYKLIAPALNRLSKTKSKSVKERIEVAPVAELHAEEAQQHVDSDNDDDLFGLEQSDNEEAKQDSSDESSSDDEFARRQEIAELKKAHREVNRQRRAQERKEEEEAQEAQLASHSQAESMQPAARQFKLVTLNSANDLEELNRRKQAASFNDRLRIMEELEPLVTNIGQSQGNRQMSFDLKKKVSHAAKKREYERKKHREERKQAARPARSLKLKRINFK